MAFIETLREPIIKVLATIEGCTPKELRMRIGAERIVGKLFDQKITLADLDTAIDLLKTNGILTSNEDEQYTRNWFDQDLAQRCRAMAPELWDEGTK